MISVAIVEDTDEIRESLRVVINGSHGFECRHVFSSAEDALDKLPHYSIDVVLMDINLPLMNGIECMNLLLDKMSNTQFMMCTVCDDDESIFNALQSGATGYILKSTSPVQILEAIKELTAGGSPMSSEIARKIVKAMQQKKTSAAVKVDFTEREKIILDFLSKGFLYKEIAEELNLSKETIKKHIHHIYEKLHVQNRTEALNKVFPR